MKRRKGFTLSELLVVVVIIGVLSAVVLPKFSKVIETRKTTEAEELMSAVRTEQEARCTLNRSYTDQTDKLGSYKAGKNYDYSLGTVGMSASAKSGKYKLEIPSYADGRICCSDIETGACNNLNKNYPFCDDLINHTPDYVVGNQNCEVNPCIGEECYEKPTPCDKTAKEESCPVPYVGKIYYGVNESCEYYETSRTCDCGNKEEHTAGTVTETDSAGCTVSTTWTFTDYPACKWNKTETKSDCPSNECDSDAKPATEKDCGCGYKQTRSVKCDASTDYEWKIQVGSSTDAEGWGACGKPKNGATRSTVCTTTSGGNGTKTETWYDSSCQWKEGECKCSPSRGNSYKEKCEPEIQLGSYTLQSGSHKVNYAMVTYTWNSDTCQYDADESGCTDPSTGWTGGTAGYDCSCFYSGGSAFVALSGGSVQVGSGIGSQGGSSCNLNYNSSNQDIVNCYCPNSNKCAQAIYKWDNGIYPGSGSCRFNCQISSQDSTHERTVVYSILSCACIPK